MGYTSGYGTIKSSAIVNRIRESVEFDTQYEYVGLGVSNGFLLKLNRKTLMAFELGLDLLPLNSSYKAEGNGLLLKDTYREGIS